MVEIPPVTDVDEFFVAHAPLVWSGRNGVEACDAIGGINKHLCSSSSRRATQILHLLLQPQNPLPARRSRIGNISLRRSLILFLLADEP
jgi:hypothetical protein